jgi:hypothetical protein
MQDHQSHQEFPILCAPRRRGEVDSARVSTETQLKDLKVDNINREPATHKPQRQGHAQPFLPKDNLQIMTLVNIHVYLDLLWIETCIIGGRTPSTSEGFLSTQAVLGTTRTWCACGVVQSDYSFQLIFILYIYVAPGRNRTLCNSIGAGLCWNGLFPY